MALCNSTPIFLFWGFRATLKFVWEKNEGNPCFSAGVTPAYLFCTFLPHVNSPITWNTRVSIHPFSPSKFDVDLLLQISMNVLLIPTIVILLLQISMNAQCCHPTIVMLTQTAPTQWEDTPVLATLDILAQDNNAQVNILLLSQENVISIS